MVEAHPVFPERFNLAEYYLDARIDEGRGERTALIVKGEAFTYAEVQARANRAADALRGAGVRRGERVLLLLFDGVPFVEAWFGTLKAGAVFCMANPLGTAEDIAYLLAYTGCTAVVADVSLRKKIDAAASDCHARFFVGDGAPAKGWTAWSDALEASSPALNNTPTHRDDVCGWLFTSGTTGKPKAAVHLHRHFAFNTEVYAKRTLGLREDDVFVSVSRLFFGYGTGTNLMFPFAVGATAVLFPEKPTAARLFEHIERHGVTVLTNVPAMIRQMVDHEASVNTSSLRICLSAGEALPPELMTRWNERFGDVPILDGIGSAEMFHIYITNRPGDVRPGSLGRLVEGYATRIVDEAGNDVPLGERGRLWVRGESAALCYWQDQDKSHATFHGPWCITADVFRQDGEGYFFYEGRADDMLKVGGQFVSPLEIEHCLMAHDAVLECAIVGQRHEGLTVPHAFVVLEEGNVGDEAMEQSLKAHCQAHLTRYKFPRLFTFRGPLPRNDRGKINRRALGGTKAEPVGETRTVESPVFVDEMTYEEASGHRGAVAFLPSGATEAHGPHLPLATDVIISRESARRAALRLRAEGVDAVVLPPLAYAVTEFAADFSGTVSLPFETAKAMIRDVILGARRAGFGPVVICNAHLEPGNLKALYEAADAARKEGAVVAFPDITRKPHALRLGDEFRSGACHAGRYETSLVLAARPELVRDNRHQLAPNPASLSVAIRDGKTSFLEAGGDRAYFGYPDEGSVAEGQELHDTHADIFAEAARELIRQLE